MARRNLFMIFSKKVDRAFELQAEQNGHDEHTEYERTSLDPKSVEDEVQLADRMEKGDLLAMIIAALGTIMPVAIIILLIMVISACLLTGFF